MADLKITELAALAGANLAAGDLLAVADISASETKKITVTDLVGNATTLIADATIPGAKILFSSGQIPGTAVATGGIDTLQLADDAITAAKIDGNVVCQVLASLPVSGGYVGQFALDTDDNKLYLWDGSTWRTIKASASANTFVSTSAGIVNIDVTVNVDEVTITASLDDTNAAGQFLAGPTASAGAVTYRTIAAGDLPTATSSDKGAVIVNGNGLTISSDVIAINNSITAETVDYHVVQYNAQGLVTAGRAISGSDLPNASAGSVGVVSPGTGLDVDAFGTLNHANSVVAATATKITFDSEGHVTATDTLVEADIPSLSADKITSGTFTADRLAAGSVTGPKFADFAVSKFGEIQPTADHIGQFFFNPLTRDLYLWDGNVYQPVGISAGEIVLAGTYDASTNLLDSVTAEGTAAGFTNGQPLPGAAELNNRYYVVVSQTGTGTSPAPTVTLEPPDILLSNGSSYVLIETSETITAQIASNVGFTPVGSIASTNVQAAIAEVDTEKVAKAGDTMTGDLLLDNCNLVFEGSTENDYETTLTVTDPTADRTITFKDASGTVAFTSDLDDGTY
jgi:hypothetical protein